MDALMSNLEEAESSRKRRRRDDDRRRLRAVLEALALEAWTTKLNTANTWLAYSRGEAAYIGPDRYRHPHATLTTVRTVIDFLATAGLIEHRRGSYHRNDHGFGQSGHGYLSRFRATEKLIEWAEAWRLTARDIALSDRFELLRLKGPADTQTGRRPLLAYEETSDTADMRKRLGAWTTMMRDHAVTLPLPADGEAGGHATGPEDPLGDPEESSPDGMGACRLHRVFNEGRWDRGGRFFGGWWQNLSGGDRSRLLIDGERTVELDFASLHPRLCYHLSGLPMASGEDPYNVPGVPSDLRDVVKVAMMQLLNAEPGKKRFAISPGTRARLSGRLSYAMLISRLEEHHHPIQSWFRQGTRGLELQAIDAAIADKVMAYFVAKGRPILPVHDSFIVANQDELTLASAMVQAYADELGRWSDINATPVIKGWSGEEARIGFQALLSV